MVSDSKNTAPHIHMRLVNYLPPLLCTIITVISKDYRVQNRHMVIHPRLNKLVSSLRTAVEKGDGSLDIDATSFECSFESIRLLMLFWHW